jgi:hypothetical protein
MTTLGTQDTQRRQTKHKITLKYCSDVVFLFCFLLLFLLLIISVRGARRYQRGSQNPYIEEEQITQWPKEKVRKDKQRSTKKYT